MSRIFALASLTALVLLTNSATAQTSRPPYTRPAPPSRDFLDRFHLQSQWQVYVPVGGLDDGIGLVQWIDGDVFVQTRRSRLIMIDGETGEIRWQFTPDRPSTNLYPVGANERSVFLLNGITLYSLIRATGVRVWDYNLGDAPSGGPLVKDDRILVTVRSTQVVNLELPDPVRILREGSDEDRARRRDNPLTPDRSRYRDAIENTMLSRDLIPPVQLAPAQVEGYLGSNASPSVTMLPSLQPPYRLDIGGRSPSISILETLQEPYRLPDGNKTPSVVALPPSVARAIELNSIAPKLIEPRRNWVHASPGTIGYSLREMRGRFLVPTSGPLTYAVSIASGRVLEQVPVQERLTAQPAVAGEIAYLPDAASYLHAHNFRLDREEWRYVGPGPLDVAPVVSDDRVFVGNHRYGIASVDRKWGVGVWTNTDAIRFIAANPKFVYANDMAGRLIIVDRARGLTLARWNGSEDFNIPIRNETNDRVLMAANNGLLICLRDRDYPKPVPLYTPPPPMEENGEGGDWDMMPEQRMP